MFFGLALLAGLVGYSFVPTIGEEEDGIATDDSNAETTETEASGGDLLSSLAPDTPTETETDTDEADDVSTDGDAGEDDTAEDTGSDDPDVDETGTVIDGTDEDDLIYGGDDDYTMNGEGGDDELHGGDGNTTLNGGEGNDRLFAGDGFTDQSSNTLNGGAGNDTIYGSNEAENTLNGGEGDDEIHMRGDDTATGGEGADSFTYSTEYSDGDLTTVTDYDAAEDQIIVEHAAGFVSGGALTQPEVSITITGENAVICLDGEECITVQGAANSLTVADIMLRANPSL